jgi:hypothetical protein
MSESHKKRCLDNPEELQKKLETLARIHEKMRTDEKTKQAISKRNRDWWENADQSTLDRLSETRSINATNLWNDEVKRKEMSDGIRKAHARMSEDVKQERNRKLRAGSEKYYENLSATDREQLAERANRTLRSEKAIAKYKEVRLRKLVLNRVLIVESRAELSRLLGVTGIGIKSLGSKGYDLRVGFFIENFDTDKHKDAVLITSLDGVKRIFPVSGNSKPIKNSNGEVFLSITEAADSIVGSGVSEQVKQSSISEARKRGIKAYGVHWFYPEPDEIEVEIMKRLDAFITEYKNAE